MLRDQKKKAAFFIALCLFTFFPWIGPSMIRGADYPSRPITMIIQMTTGGVTDIVARKLADSVSKDLGQPIVPVNKPGGGGTLGVGELVRSKADGYTFGCVSLPTVAVIPHLQTLPYDPLKDISHVCALLPYELGLYVKADAPWKSFEDLIDYARKNPGKVTYGSPGPGTINHLSTVLIAREYSLDWKNVPYKGDGEQIAAVLGGHISVGVSGPAAIIPHIKGGKLRLLVVTTKDRWLQLSEVPTLLDKGHKVILTSYLSLGLPAGTPEPIRQKLEESFRKALQDLNIKKEFEEKFHTRLSYIGGAEYAKFVKEQYLYYKEFLKTIGMTK